MKKNFLKNSMLAFGVTFFIMILSMVIVESVCDTFARNIIQHNELYDMQSYTEEDKEDFNDQLERYNGENGIVEIHEDQYELYINARASIKNEVINVMVMAIVISLIYGYIKTLYEELADKSILKKRIRLFYIIGAIFTFAIASLISTTISANSIIQPAIFEGIVSVLWYSAIFGIAVLIQSKKAKKNAKILNELVKEQK